MYACAHARTHTLMPTHPGVPVCMFICVSQSNCKQKQDYIKICNIPSLRASCVEWLKMSLLNIIFQWSIISLVQTSWFEEKANDKNKKRSTEQEILRLCGSSPSQCFEIIDSTTDYQSNQ